MRPLTQTPFIAALILLLAACGTPDDDSPTHQYPGDDAPGELLHSELNRELSPQVADASRAQLSADNRSFAFDLIEEIRSTDDDNIFFSPHSISIALAMTYPGTSGDTKAQLADLLRFNLDEDDLHSAFNALDLDLASRSEVDLDEDEGDPPILNVVNASWGQYNYPFAKPFLDTIAHNYGAGLRTVDFTADPDAVRLDINQWVEDQTNERIKDLLPMGSLDTSTRLVLTNAIYFLASWQNPFPETATSDAPFQLLSGTEVDVPLMSITAEFPYYSDAYTNAVSLPYAGGQLSFVALQPKIAEDFQNWEQALNQDRFDSIIANLSTAHGSVELPRFQTEGDYDLKKLFTVMGWTNYSDLSAMVDGAPADLFISQILHKSFINLDEDGTEAAAATAVVVNRDSAPGFQYDLRFDRPFYYAIYDHPSDSILFLGRMMNPAE